VDSPDVPPEREPLLDEHAIEAIARRVTQLLRHDPRCGGAWTAGVGGWDREALRCLASVGLRERRPARRRAPRPRWAPSA